VRVAHALPVRRSSPTLSRMNRIGDNLIHTGCNRDLIDAFASAGVEFLLIGGLAVAWFCPDRQADDMDLLVNPTEENSARISSALTRLGMSGFDTRSFARAGLQVPLKHTLYADLLTPEADALSYEEVERTSIEGKLFGFPIHIASPEALVHLKERAMAASEAMASKHGEDIRRLRAYAG
jgi:hypothetical protein